MACLDSAGVSTTTSCPARARNTAQFQPTAYSEPFSGSQAKAESRSFKQPPPQHRMASPPRPPHADNARPEQKRKQKRKPHQDTEHQKQHIQIRRYNNKLNT